MLTQADLDHLREQWAKQLPAQNTAGAPFYTMMKFNGEQNLGEVYAYPAVKLDFDVHIMAVTLFPTLEIAQECATQIQAFAPEYQIVGLTDEFLELLLKLVLIQEIKLTISLSPNDSVIWATSKVKELAEEIRTNGFTPALLEVAAAE